MFFSVRQLSYLSKSRNKSKISYFAYLHYSFRDGDVKKKLHVAWGTNATNSIHDKTKIPRLEIKSCLQPGLGSIIRDSITIAIT